MKSKRISIDKKMQKSEQIQKEPHECLSMNPVLVCQDTNDICFLKTGEVAKYFCLEDWVGRGERKRDEEVEGGRCWTRNLPLGQTEAGWTQFFEVLSFNHSA